MQAMGQEVPQVKNGPLATALNCIRDPTYNDDKKKQKNARAGRGGRGGGRAGRGRGGGRQGGRGSAYSSAASSRASSASSDGWSSSDGEDGGEAAAAGLAADGEAAAAAKKWLRAPQSALERAAGELAACGIAVGCRWETLHQQSQASLMTTSVARLHKYLKVPELL
jgi:hypothetical protein